MARELGIALPVRVLRLAYGIYGGGLFVQLPHGQTGILDYSYRKRKRPQEGDVLIVRQYGDRLIRSNGHDSYFPRLREMRHVKPK